MARGRIALAAGAVAVAVALLVLLVRDERRTSRSAPPLPALANGDALEPASRPADAGEHAADSPAGRDGRDGVAPASELAAPPEGLSLRVVRASDGTPVAGARVLYLEDSRADPLELQRFRRDVASGFDELSRSFGGSTRTDTRGVARIPWPDVSVRVGCEHEGLWGERELLPDEEGVPELRLEPSRSLAVRVVDGNGSPVVGAPIALRMRAGAAPFVAQERKLSDRDGRARFEHLLLAAEQRGVPLEHLVALDIASAAPVQARVDPERWPGGPLVLVMPDTGRVEIELLGPDGTVAPVGGLLELVPSADRRFALALADHDQDSWGCWAELARGRAAFERIGLGTVLSAQAFADGWDPVRLEFAGPTASGATVRVQIALVNQAPVLVGRALGEDGRPLADRTLDCEFWRGSPASGLSWTSSVRTDAEGRFGGLGRGFLRAEQWTVRFRVHGSAPELSVARELPLALQGVHDLGDVTLGAPAVLVSGVARDERGTPIHGVRLQVECMALDAKRRESWSPLPGGGTRTDVAGVFAVRAPKPLGPSRLRASRTGFVPLEPVPLLALPARQDLVLERGGTLAGRIVVPDDRAEERVELVLAGGPRGAGEFAWLDDERFRWSALPPGSYDLRVWLRRDPGGGSHAIDGIAVRAGEHVSDPRLDPLDVASIAHSHRLTVVGEGRAVTGASIALRSAQEEWSEPPVSVDAAGRYALWSFRDALPEVRVRAPGFREVVLADVSGDVSVVLEPALRVRILADEPLPRLKPGWRVVAQLDETRGAFDAAGAAELRLEHAGQHLLLLLLIREARGTEWQRVSLGTFDVFYDVVESLDEQVFTMPALPERIRAQLDAYSEAR